MSHRLFWKILIPGLFVAGSLLMTQCTPATILPTPTPTPYPTAPAASRIAVTIYADDSYPPYAYQEGDIVKGLYTEILTVAFSRMSEYEITLEAIPWKRGLNYLEQGVGFALYPPYYTPDTRPYINPYSVGILEEKVAVFCREEVLETPRPAWPQDYYGLTIGKNLGFEVGGTAFNQAVAENRITLEESSGNRSNLLKVASGRIDCYLNDRFAILWELNRLQDNGEYDPGGAHARIIEGATASTEWGHVGFTGMDQGRFPFKEAFVAELNGILEEMKANGEIETIVNAYLQ